MYKGHINATGCLNTIMQPILLFLICFYDSTGNALVVYQYISIFNLHVHTGKADCLGSESQLNSKLLSMSAKQHLRKSVS
jgi:hypothetical protein